jgi:hypothetical protein
MSIKHLRGAAISALALVIAGGVSAAYATTGTATGSDGYTPITQTRIYDSTHLTGDHLLGAYKTVTLTVSTSLVPRGASAVSIQLTAASETAVNGDLDVNNQAATTSNLNFTRETNITSETTAKLSATNTFTVTNHSAGTVRLVVDVLGYFAPTTPYTTPTTITHDFGGVSQAAFGGTFSTNSLQVGDKLTVPAGTYLVNLSMKAAPDSTYAAANPSVEVTPGVFLYVGHKPSSGFVGNVLNIGNSSLETGGNHNIDNYWSGTTTITVPTGGEDLYAYEFGYGNNQGAGFYDLEDASIILTPVGTVTGS